MHVALGFCPLGIHWYYQRVSTVHPFWKLQRLLTSSKSLKVYLSNKGATWTQTLGTSWTDEAHAMLGSNPPGFASLVHEEHSIPSCLITFDTGMCAHLRHGQQFWNCVHCCITFVNFISVRALNYPLTMYNEEAILFKSFLSRKWRSIWYSSFLHTNFQWLPKCQGWKDLVEPQAEVILLWLACLHWEERKALRT